jgi:hypothetical protein
MKMNIANGFFEKTFQKGISAQYEFGFCPRMVEDLTCRR